MPTFWHKLFRDRLVGDASEDYIRIYRVRPWLRNDLAPEFRGHVRADGQAIAGVFRPTPFARWFLTIWLGAVLALFLPMELWSIAQDGMTTSHQQRLFFYLLMLLVGSAMPWIGWYFGEADIEKIETVIRKAAGVSA